MPVLAAIQKSLGMFGHPPTEVIFTDNVHTNKCEFEKVFPSRVKDVVPILVTCGSGPLLHMAGYESLFSNRMC